MSDHPDSGIPDVLLPWLNQRREEIAHVAMTRSIEEAEILRAQSVAELEAALAAYEEGHHVKVVLTGDPVALLAGRPVEHGPTLSLSIDESRVTVIRAGE